MKPNPGAEALRELADMGYRFTVNGETIKARYAGPGKPDPGQVRPLLARVKEHKAEAIGFLALTCADCPHFSAYPGLNPRQAWGRCLKRGRGRFGCATPCKAALINEVLGVREILINAQYEV